MLEFYQKGTNRFQKITNTEQEQAQHTTGDTKRNGEHETFSIKTQFEYNADYAQMKAEYKMTATAAPLKLGKNMVLAEKIRGPISSF